MANIKCRTIIKKDGQLITEVLEKSQAVQCSAVKQYTGGFGKEVSDEQTGPECDDVHEVQC